MEVTRVSSDILVGSQLDLSTFAALVAHAKEDLRCRNPPLESRDPSRLEELFIKASPFRIAFFTILT
jgi:hypothetical protein